MSILVTQKLVKENKDFGRTINQLMEIFINREIKKRGVKEFSATIVEMFGDSREPKIYLNEEASFVLTLKEPLPKNSVGLMNVKLEDLENIQWHKEKLDPNTAKFAIVKWNKHYWVLDFDFRYNRAVVKEKIKKSKEFLQSAKSINEENPKIYLLWSAYELALDAQLYQLPHHAPKEDHRDRKDKLQKLQKNSTLFLPEFYNTFCLLSRAKNPARYAGNVDASIDNLFLNEAIKTLEKTIKIFCSV